MDAQLARFLQSVLPTTLYRKVMGGAFNVAMKSK
jgi:hypothetical protein